MDISEETAGLINQDLNSIQKWANNWLVTFSAPKTKSLTIGDKKHSNLNPPVWLNDQKVEKVPDHVYLGQKRSHNLRWRHHINDSSVNARKRLNY